METKRQLRGGGRAYHSALAPHFEAIRQWRKERKTWKEIAELLLREKHLRVTLYAPYRFMRRRLKRKAHWEEPFGANADPPAAEPQPIRPKATGNRSRLGPVLPASGFHRPDRKSFNPEEYL